MDLSTDYDYDVLIIGAGPGGYVAAIRAAQLGLSVAVIEKDKPGGVCLNWGCIPSKALINQAEMYASLEDMEKTGIMVDRSAFDYKQVYLKSRKASDALVRGVQFLFKKNKVEYIQGTAKISGKNEVTVDGDRKIRAKNIILAPGSRPRTIPGFELDEERIISSTGALSLKKLPKKMLILGSGAIGVEFAHLFNRFGVEIVLVEILDSILPIEDREVVQVINRSFTKRGIKILTGTKAVAQQAVGDLIRVELEGKDGKKDSVDVDMVLVAVGRAPNSEDAGLESVGITTEKGFIPVGDHYQTNVPGIFAIGDVINTPLLAHVASKEGEIAVEFIAGKNPPPHVDPMEIPAGVYCEPQYGSFGLNEEAAKEKGLSYSKAVFPYRGIGKAVAVEHPDGILKVLFDPDTHEILGAHVAGAEATEMIHEMLLAKTGELLPQNVAEMIHAHPTLSEGVMEVMRAVEGWAIHA